MIIPSIDLMDGKAVQLVKGREKVLERDNPVELAKEFSKYGQVAVVDLDAALGRGDNLDIIEEICKVADCRVGGGIRSYKKANKILRLGAKKIIIGTKAEPKFLEKLPKSKIIVSIDSKNGKVMEEGWARKIENSPEELIMKLENYCSEFLFTDIDREGLMKGVNMRKVKKLNQLSDNKFTAAGGINSIEEMQKLERIEVNPQIGLSLYKNKIDLKQAFISLVNFKRKSLIPTIVKDTSGQILMLAYSSKKSLLKTFRTNKVAYYSRNRKKLWVKGETSGNYQELLSARWDCDRDALLFTVDQKGNACHTGQYSCFKEKKFNLDDLLKILNKKPLSKVPGSYTCKLLNNENLLKSKIKEETNEVINYKNKDNLVWEISDLFYFILVLMAKNNINMQSIRSELERRRNENC